MDKTLCIPKAAIAPDGPAPEIGDPITLEVAGKVSRIEGDKFYIEAESANGVPILDDAPAADPTDEDIRGMGETADSEEGYP